MKSRFTDSQIIGLLWQAETGTPTLELCRAHGISSATILQSAQQVRRYWGVADVPTQRAAFRTKANTIAVTVTLTVTRQADKRECAQIMACSN